MALPKPWLGFIGAGTITEVIVTGIASPGGSRHPNYRIASLRKKRRAPHDLVIAGDCCS